MKNRTLQIVLLMLAVVFAQVAVAQFRRGRGRGRSGFQRGQPPANRNGVPNWDNAAEFKSDVFTFARVEYNSHYNYGKWLTDWPDSDLNFSYRLQQLTSLKVDPNGVTVKLTDPNLFDFPFLYMIEPGNLEFTPAEVVALRRYLLNGGFMMVDDFWGVDEWRNFHYEIKRVFPDREPVELPLEHPIFHCVYDLDEKPQVVSIHAWLNGNRTERWDATEPHYKGIFDDKGRMMVVICHNTDLGDGWEREGENHEYFKECSEKYSYPMGINIVFYAMTH